MSIISHQKKGQILFSKFNKKIDTIFLDKDSPEFSTKEKVNVIISPSLYWVKRVSLPVKYVRQVYALLPSLFEDILPEGIYSYSAYKSGDEFYIFAYNDKLILDTLSQKKITNSQIKNVYFAQSELSFIETPVKINEMQSLYLKDDILMLIPSVWLEENSDLNLAALTLSKHKITLKQFSHLVNDKSLYTLIAIASVLLVLIATEYFITMDKVSKTTTMKEKLFSQNKLKPTMFQNRAMLKKLRNTHKTQINLRTNMGNILKTVLQKEQHLSMVEVKNKTLKVEFVGVKLGKESRIIKELKSKKIPFNSSVKNELLRLEFKI